MRARSSSRRLVERDVVHPHPVDPDRRGADEDLRRGRGASEGARGLDPAASDHFEALGSPAPVHHACTCEIDDGIGAGDRFARQGLLGARVDA
jgi:hypothetical protein